MEGRIGSATHPREACRRNVKVQITEEETLDFGRQLARRQEQYNSAEERKKDVDAQLKAEMESHRAEALRLSRIVNSGYEYREVDCWMNWDYERFEVAVFRADTGEMLEGRPMTRDERDAPRLM